MAISNLDSWDSSACSSPRLSFSKDLRQNNNNHHHDHTQQEEVCLDRLDMSLLSSSSSSSSSLSTDPSFDFNFCVTAAAFSEPESFPADDLFYNGVIIPIQMKQKLNSMQQEEVTSATTATIIREEKTSSKSFWRFRRSSSLNCENYGHKKSSSSWSMQLLFRSKSTGSSSNDNPKQSHKNSSSNNGKSMNTTTTNNNNNNNNQNISVRYSTSSYQKPPLKKSGSGGFRNCASSLNVPPPYITKGTSDLLGFNSLFRNGIKEKKSKNY